MSLTAINRHINVHEEAGRVIRRKAGRVNFLSISRSTMRQVQDWALRYNAMWGTDDETLENYLPDMVAAGVVEHGCGNRTHVGRRTHEFHASGFEFGVGLANVFYLE